LISEILTVVHGRSGIDFTAYRAATVERRIRNRMLTLGIAELPRYYELLAASADEALRLVERITIKVSRFYRNREVFDALRGTLLPELAARGAPLALWSAGCGRGEEAYTLAMLLEEGGWPGEVLATDIDPQALALAEAATYPAQQAQELPDALASRFLEPAGGRGLVRVAERVRSRVRFERADLAAAQAGGPRFDLACCRNVLIYWGADHQRRIVEALAARLRPSGYLCIGEAEWLDERFAGALAPLPGKLRIFRRTGAGEPA
jgi:chemotaxis methyl-accepting protein methylase